MARRGVGREVTAAVGKNPFFKKKRILKRVMK
jgi:hypothetical protein